MEKMYLQLTHIKRLSIAGVMLAMLIGCKKELEKKPTPLGMASPYSFIIPKGFPPPNLSKENPLTEEGIALGKQLYSDPLLSTNGRSCMSCHQPELSFSIPLFITKEGQAISVPPHVNLAFKSHYNWEGNITLLDTLAMGDFEPEFFNTDHDLLVEKLKQKPHYIQLLRTAFGIWDPGSISFRALKLLVAKSLAQYLYSRISANSKFDLYRQKKVLLNNEELQGYYLFYSEKGDCFHCHGEPLFTDNEFHNNGISGYYNGFDKGKEMHTFQSKDKGKFVTPTLRNIELTAPYMHDGRFKTLEEVIDFYDSGVHNNEWVDPLMTKQNGTQKLNLSPKEKQQLIAFLRTLTDTSFLKYP